MAGLEVCYDARKLRREVLIDDNLTITKDDDSEASEARYKTTLRERQAHELEIADRYFSMKYGITWRGKLYFDNVEEYMR